MELNHENYLILKEQKHTRAQIATMLGLTENQLKKHITKHGWAAKKPTLDERVFSATNEESAYWAGFLAADGSVDAKGRVRVMLKHSDIGHLVKYSKFLKSTYKIQENTVKYDRCALEFTSINICVDLYTNYSIIPNKSLCLEPPKLDLGVYLKDFIRGYFDGDGSICESFSNVNSRTASIYATLVSGSHKFTEWLARVLDSIEVTYSIQRFDNKSQIKMNTLQAKKFLKYIYTGAKIYLDRKFELYEKLCIRQDVTTR
jgi:hypothetical protein